MDVVTDNGIAYITVESHRSTTIADDLASGKLAIYQGVLRTDLENESDAAKGDALVVVHRALPGAAPNRLHDWIECQPVSAVADFLADRTGNIPATDLLNAGIGSFADGVFVIPPGVYYVEDVLISAKAPVDKGAFKIEATGAVFIGAGRIIINGCKRVKISGLDAPNHDLCFRGTWWSTFANMRFRRLVLGDEPGSHFNSNYWNEWRQCLFQGIVVGPNSSYNNKFDFYSCSLRGNAGQGFTGTLDYALDFTGDKNCQAWVFHGGDISYHGIDIILLSSMNTSDVEVFFDGVYFDTKYPKSISRQKTRIRSRGCHSGNDLPNSAPLPAVSRGEQDSWRQDRSAGWAQFSGVNLIPNGDFRTGLPSYVGAGAPVGSTGGATITEMSGAGLYGRYININQPTNGVVRFRPRAVPFNGRYTSVVIIRNANPGETSVQLGFNSLYNQFTISSSEWSFWTLTSGADIASGTVPDIILSRPDGTPFNVDVCYASVAFGEGGMPFMPALPSQELNGSAGYNPPSLAPGASASTTVTVKGCAFGDHVLQPGFTIDTQGVEMRARISAADTVTVTFTNSTPATIDLGAGTLHVRVQKRS